VPSEGPRWATIPLGTATGTYYLLACADDTQQIVEAQRGQQLPRGAGTIAVGPATADLVGDGGERPAGDGGRQRGFV
jgi:hypothetical protein